MASCQINRNDARKFTKEMYDAGAPDWLLNEVTSILNAEMTIFGMAVVRALWYAYTEELHPGQGDRSWFDMLSEGQATYIGLNYLRIQTDLACRLRTLADASRLSRDVVPFSEAVVYLGSLELLLPSLFDQPVPDLSLTLHRCGEAVERKFGRPAIQGKLTTSEFLRGIAGMNSSAAGVWYLPDPTE